MLVTLNVTVDLTVGCTVPGFKEKRGELLSYWCCSRASCICFIWAWCTLVSAAVQCPRLIRKTPAPVPDRILPHIELNRVKYKLTQRTQSIKQYNNNSATRHTSAGVFRTSVSHQHDCVVVVAESKEKGLIGVMHFWPSGLITTIILKWVGPIQMYSQVHLKTNYDQFKMSARCSSTAITNAICFVCLADTTGILNLCIIMNIFPCLSFGILK